MAGNTDIVKQGYEAFSRGDTDAMAEMMTEGFTFEGPNAEELPGAGRHEGKDAALQALGSVAGAWDEFKLVPDEFFEQGDSVVVLAHSEVSKDGRSARIPVVHIWRLEDGKASRMQALPDTLQAARTLGLV